VAEKQLSAWVLFGQEVRRLRMDAGLSLDQVAQNLSITGGMLSKIERATRAAKKETAAELDAFLRTDGILLRRWSDTTRKALDPEWYRRITDAEQRAVEIRMVHPSLIPGSLQTRGYTRAVLSHGRPLDDPEEIEALVELRTKRAARLLRPGDPRMAAVIPEAVLRRQMGDDQVMHEQLDHLLALAEAGAVKLQVLPEGVPSAIAAASSAFRLITFTDRLPLVFADSASGGVLVDESREVQRFVSIMASLAAWGLSPADSIGRIKNIRGEGTDDE
jgi:transcriptional regulator with XRE-family HTH domain